MSTVNWKADGSGSMVVTVPGVAAPKGSKRHVGGGRMVDPENTRHWQELVAMTVFERLPDGWVRLRRAAAVNLTFRFARPKAHYRPNGDISARYLHVEHTKRPDIDKLSRTILDALTTAGVWADDSQVYAMSARKTYAGPGDTPGVSILVTWGPQ